MRAIKKKVVDFLLDNWKKIPGAIQWAIKQVGGYAIVEAIYNGFTALFNYLSGLADWVVNKIASLLGL